MSLFTKREIGDQGEKVSAEYLKSAGYRIAERNYQCRFGEIDIIAFNSEYICFIEVKARRSDSMVSGCEAVDAFKQRRVIMTAKHYLLHNPSVLQPRFDVIEVGLSTDGRPIKGSINHIINAFSE